MATRCTWSVKFTEDFILKLVFQPSQLVNKIKQCTVLETDTDLRLKEIHESHLELSDAELLRANLKGLYEGLLAFYVFFFIII